jgi:hypothetical protein
MKKEEEKALITFLKRTKNGEYAKIDRSALTYPRVKEQACYQGTAIRCYQGALLN